MGGEGRGGQEAVGMGMGRQRLTETEKGSWKSRMTTGQHRPSNGRSMADWGLGVDGENTEAASSK